MLLRSRNPYDFRGLEDTRKKHSRAGVLSGAPEMLAKQTTPVTTGDSINTRCLQAWDEVAEIAPAWESLVSRVPTSSIFQTFQWNACWWNAFGGVNRPLVVLCYRGRELIGIAPMMISGRHQPSSQSHQEIRFIGCSNFASDYLDFIIDSDAPEALGALLDEIRHHLAKVDRIELSHFPTHSKNYVRTLEYLRVHDARVVVELEQEAPCRILGNKEEDLKAANKSSLRRRYNFFKKSGDLQFRQCDSEAEILEYLNTFFEQHIARRDLTVSKSQFLDPRQKSFYRDLVSKLFSGGWLRFHVVLFDGEPIAFHFGFEYQRKFIWYKPTFDVEYRKRSPGEVLIKFLLEDAIDKSLDEFDFTVGSESFKHRFSNKVRYNNRVTVFTSFTSFWTFRSRLALRTLKSRIKKTLVSVQQSR